MVSTGAAAFKKLIESNILCDGNIAYANASVNVAIASLRYSRVIFHMIMIVRTK